MHTNKIFCLNNMRGATSIFLRIKVGQLQTKNFSTENTKKMHSYLKELSYLINSHSRLMFLKQQLQLVEKIEDFVHNLGQTTQEHMVSQSKCDNAFYAIKNSKEIYLKEDQWNIIYQMTLDPSLSPENDGLTQNTHIDNNTSKNTLHKSLINLQKRLLMDYNKQKNSKYYRLSKIFANHPNFIKTLEYEIKYYISQKITEKVTYLILSDFAIFLGNNLILLLIGTDEMFSHIISIIQPSLNIKNPKIEKFITLFNHFLELYKKNDFKTINLSYFKSFESIYEEKDIKLIADIIILYIMKSIADCKSNINYYKYLSALFPLLETLTLTNSLEKDLLEMSIQQGNIICNILIEEYLFHYTLISENNEKVKYKTIAIITPCDSLKQDVMLYKVIRPYLHISNDKLNHKNKNNIHNNIKTTISIKENSYYNKEPFVGVRHKIDLPYLLFILKNLASINSISLNTHNNLLIVIYTLYDITLIEIDNFLSIDNKKITRIIELIIVYLYDFNDMNFEIINSKIHLLKKIYKEDKNQWQKMKNVLFMLEEFFNKIKNTKYIIKGLLEDAVLYSRFKYILNNLFIDSRGRAYESANFLNIQNFNTAKTLVKPFGDPSMLTKDNINIIAEGIKSGLNALHDESALLDIQLNYQEYDKRVYINYLYNYINSSKITREAFKEWFLNENERRNTSNNLETIEYLYTIVKKPKYAIILHSIIYQKYNINSIDYLDEYFELDATSSGLQMIAMLLRSKHLATVTNLIGNEATDIYVLANHGFMARLKSYNDILYNFKSLCYKLRLLTDENESLEPTFSKDTVNLEDITSSELVKMFIKIHFNNPQMKDILLKIQELFETYQEDINIFKETNKLETWIQNSLVPKNFYKNIKVTKIGYYLIKIKIINTLVEIIKINKWNSLEFLNDRERFKHAIMTLVYNSTSFGRKKQFKKHLIESNKTLQKLNFNHVTFLVIYMENYFMNAFRLEHLPEYDTMSEISDLLIGKKLIQNPQSNKSSKEEIPGNGIIIENKNFIINYTPRKVQKIRVNTAFYNKEGKRQRTTSFQLHLPSKEFDAQAFRRGFSPNFIQSLDASIVHDFKEFFINLNIYLKEQNLDYFVNDHTNHDSFGSNLKPFLPIIIKYCYYNLYLSNPFNTLLWSNPHITQDLKELISFLDKDLIINSLYDFNDNFIK